MKKLLVTLTLLGLSLTPTQAAYIKTSSLRAVDGDTLYNKETGEYYRLADIDTPEVGQCGYWEARNFLGLYLVSRDLVEITTLYKDVYDRMVVEVDNLSYTLLQEGLAKPYIIDKQSPHFKPYWAVWYHTPHQANFGKVCP